MENAPDQASKYIVSMSLLLQRGISRFVLPKLSEPDDEFRIA